LQAVLEPEGFTFARVRSARIALRDAALIDPAIVIIDEGLPDLDAPDLASSLVEGPLRSSVPILVYSPNFWHESAQAEAMRAGAWDIIKEPVRSKLIVAKLRRLLEIRRLIEATEEGSLSDMSTGLFNLAGLIRVMRILGSVSRRNGSPLSCMVIGPARPQSGEASSRRRRLAAELCSELTRDSDVCGWVEGEDIGIVAPETTSAGLAELARRLGRQAGEHEERAELLPLSAGIIEISAGMGAEEGSGAPDAEGVGEPSSMRGSSSAGQQVAYLTRFAAARTALSRAREAGGGIRIADATRIDER